VRGEEVNTAWQPKICLVRYNLTAFGIPEHKPQRTQTTNSQHRYTLGGVASIYRNQSQTTNTEWSSRLHAGSGEKEGAAQNRAVPEGKKEEWPRSGWGAYHYIAARGNGRRAGVARLTGPAENAQGGRKERRTQCGGGGTETDETERKPKGGLGFKACNSRPSPVA
jgi:hypothetical protein